jgi:hypothetical protein
MASMECDGIEGPQAFAYLDWAAAHLNFLKLSSPTEKIFLDFMGAFILSVYLYAFGPYTIA